MIFLDGDVACPVLCYIITENITRNFGLPNYQNMKSKGHQANIQ